MGGYGSGRGGYRQKVEQCRTLDIYKMKRMGALEASYRGAWVWSCHGEEVAQIRVQCDGERLSLDYKVSIQGGEWEPIKQSMPLLKVACNYGGERVYVRCPGVVAGRVCGRRVGKLYAGGRYFLCRLCYDLTYTSQSEQEHDRLLRRANKLRDQLVRFDCFVDRPKGMWNRTFERKRDEVYRLDEEADLAFVRRLGGRLGCN